MAGLGPDLHVWFGFLEARTKFDDPCNSSDISKMAANFKLHMSHSHVPDTIALILLD